MNTALLLKLTVVWILCSELVPANDLQYEDNISGQITSPGFPENYTNNVNYTWIIRTGSLSANVTFTIVEMNIREWRPCDDYLEIKEIEPSCFPLFKRCGDLKNTVIVGRGKKIRVSFISDKSMTGKGFHLTWRITLPQTKTLPETQETTQKMLATTTKYKVRTTFKKIVIKTTANKRSSQVEAISTSTSGITESTTNDRSAYKYTSPTTFTTLKPEFPSTVDNLGRATSPSIPSELLTSLSIQHSEKKRTTLQTRSRPLTLSSTTRSSSVELTTLDFNATTEKEDKNTYDIKTVSSTVQATFMSSALRTTETTTEGTTSSTLIPESPSTVKNAGRTTSPPIPSELPSSLSIQHSEKKRTTLQTRSRPLTLSSTKRSSSVELTTLVFNATTEIEDKNTFDIRTVYLIIGSVVVAFLLLLVVCVCIYRSRNQARSLQKKQCQQKRDEEARNVINNANCKSVHIYDDIPVGAVYELKTSPKENNEEIEEQSTLYDKCWRNEYDRTQSAMDENNRDTEHTYDTCERFYFTLEAVHPRSIIQTATPTTTQRDSTNV